jgi:NAD(P)-dependent dehydrogenase (short-subunit alcohol dehydrogenase family)
MNAYPGPVFLPTASTGTALAGGPLLGGHKLLVIGGGQQTYGMPDPPIGIGRAICVLAAREGARVAVADVDPAAARGTADIITQEENLAEAFTVDGTDDASVAGLTAGVLTRFGGLDGLVMSLGIASGDHLAGTPAREWDRVMAVNVRSHFLGCKHALPAMPAGGSIVLISSTAARIPTTSNAPAYVASKAALDGLRAAAGREAAPRGIRVNIVMPGLIDTSLGRLATLVKPDRADTPIPLGRQGTAWDIANTVVFLLSDKAAYITGQTVAVDGGLSGLP